MMSYLRILKMLVKYPKIEPHRKFSFDRDEVIDISCQSGCSAPLVKDGFYDYIRILRHFWNVIEQSPLYKAAITKQMLCTGWGGKVVDRVLKAIK